MVGDGRGGGVIIRKNSLEFLVAEIAAVVQHWAGQREDADGGCEPHRRQGGAAGA